MLCFSFRVVDSRVSLTFVLTCRAVPLSAQRGHGPCGCPLAQDYLLSPGQHLQAVNQVRELPLAVCQLAIQVEGIGGCHFFL